MIFLRFIALWIAMAALSVDAKQLSVSVVIPCVPKHAPYLFNLLSYYAKQTEVPHEVIISLSQYGAIDAGLLDTLTNAEWPFKLILIRNAERTSAGKNRNLGSDAASGDILMFQDADDIPHPQRVEIVKYFFEKYDICHLMHFYVSAKSILHDAKPPHEFIWYDKTKIVTRVHARYEESSPHLPFHNGQPCILRSLSKLIKWPDQWSVGEDVMYSQNVYRAFPAQTMIVTAHLVLYRCELSSGWPK